MSSFKIKLGATLVLDKEKEKDTIKQLEKLRSRHKLGEFISQCLRVVFENRELAEKCGLNMDRYGLTDNRKQFYEAVNKEVKQMNNKIDAIYDMAYRTYTLTQFNKKIGIEEKSKNILQAQFLLQKQMREMCNVLGIENITQVYESNKMYNLEKNVDETLEFIINYYDGIINELKENIEEVKYIHEEHSRRYKEEPVIKEVQNIENNSDMRGNSIKESTNNIEDTDNTDEDDEVIDFGLDNSKEQAQAVEFDTSDMSALLDFIQ